MTPFLPRLAAPIHTGPDHGNGETTTLTNPFATLYDRQYNTNHEGNDRMHTLNHLASLGWIFTLIIAFGVGVVFGRWSA